MTRRRSSATRGTRYICSRQRRVKKRTLYAAQDGRCAKCNTGATMEELILKHKIHRKAGGTSKLTNLHLICHPCNENGPHQEEGAVN